jgi:hypothetical protein
MTNRVSRKDELPPPVQRGSQFDVDADSPRMVPVLLEENASAARIILDPVTGFPVLSAGPDAPILTSVWVEEALSDFP